MSEVGELNGEAVAILRKNDRDGAYTVPTEGLYPFQWNWDSAFVALGLSTFDPDRAWREIETLLDAQWDDGFVPHIVFHRDDSGYFPGPAVWQTNTRPPTSGITQPPVAATVARRLWDAGAGPDTSRLQSTFDKLLGWHRWFHRHRDPSGNGLVVATHPWETGRDNSPEWDAPMRKIDTRGVEPYERRDTKIVDNAMRPSSDDYDRYLAMVQYGRDCGWNHDRIVTAGPFRVIDVGLTMILLRANKDLLGLAEVLGREREKDEILERIRLSERHIDELWSEKIQGFCSLDVDSGRLSEVLTSASFLSFYAGVGTVAQRGSLENHLVRLSKSVRFLLPSCDPRHPAFDPILYWRGPVWAVINFLASTGLKEQGLHAHAERIRSDTRTLIGNNGFYEAFCPLTGKGTGGGSFSWSAAMWLYWANAGN